MTSTLKPNHAATKKDAPLTMFHDAVEAAMSRIPPLWPLSRFVAVNPFVGLSKMEFSEAASLLGKTTGSILAMPPDFYRERYHANIIGMEDLEKSLHEVTGNTVSVESGISDLLSALKCESWGLPAHPAPTLPSAMLDSCHGSHWESFVSGEISKWCAAHYDKGQALWSSPWKGMPLFAAWKEAACLDYNPEIAGISSWRNLVRNLPDDPLMVIEDTAIKLCIPHEEATDIFYSLLMSIGGWAGHLQFLAHEKQLQGEKEESLRDLLAIRMVYEAALRLAFVDDTAPVLLPPCADAVDSVGPVHLIWQRAHECAMQRSLFGKLAAKDSNAIGAKPIGVTLEFQAVFCIDVRSEIYRRSLEKVAPNGQTIGFAGFFGFPIEAGPAGETTGTPQCPVLLKPAMRVFETLSRETLEVVLLSGHGSSTENNPYGSSFDCGACGGHTGEANARTAAAILNHPGVRSGLAGRGILIPAETWFLGGLHNTTTDEVTLLDKESAPSTHRKEIDLLRGYLARAGALAREERAPLLGLNPMDPLLIELITDRSRDWSQVRPEWGLAGNYAFIAASRERTRGIDLEGRVFLNDYSHAADEGESTLELLLCAPVVVASWINLQYYASTVDNTCFGSGDKTIHNVAGIMGIMEGNGGDIRTGLPFQSVHDGKEWRHEALRLHVCVEAPKEAIDRILKKHPSVADLIANQWIHLFAISGNSEGPQTFEKSNGHGAWSRESSQTKLPSRA